MKFLVQLGCILFAGYVFYTWSGTMEEAYSIWHDRYCNWSSNCK